MYSLSLVFSNLPITKSVTASKRLYTVVLSLDTEVRTVNDIHHQYMLNQILLSEPFLLNVFVYTCMSMHAWIRN